MIALKFYHVTGYIKQSYSNDGIFWSAYNSRCYNKFNVTRTCSGFNYYGTTTIGHTKW